MIAIDPQTKAKKRQPRIMMPMSRKGKGKKVVTHRPAITMIRHDITAGLFAPVEILVTEKERGPGTTITYVRPSSLMVIEVNPPLHSAAKALDEKLEALIAKATAA